MFSPVFTDSCSSKSPVAGLKTIHCSISLFLFVFIHTGLTLKTRLEGFIATSPRIRDSGFWRLYLLKNRIFRWRKHGCIRFIKELCWRSSSLSRPHSIGHGARRFFINLAYRNHSWNSFSFSKAFIFSFKRIKLPHSKYILFDSFVRAGSLESNAVPIFNAGFGSLLRGFLSLFELLAFLRSWATIFRSKLVGLLAFLQLDNELFVPYWTRRGPS